MRKETTAADPASSRLAVSVEQTGTAQFVKTDGITWRYRALTVR